MHLDVHALELPDEPLRLGERLRPVGADEVVTYRRIRHLDAHVVLRLVDTVRQQVTFAPLLHRLHRRRVPIQMQRAAARGGRRERDPHDGVMAVPPLVDRGAVVDLDRHPGPLEAERGQGVGEDRREEVVAVALVEVVPAAPLELLGHDRSVDVVDVVDLPVRDLVIDGIVGRREERTVVPELVMVGQHQWRVLAHQLDLAVRLGLRAAEVIAVEVERVVVAAGIERSPVGVLDRDDDHHGVLQEPVHDAVVAIGEAVHERDDRVRAALLVAVDIAAHPEERRCRLGEVIDARLGRGRVGDLVMRLPDLFETGVRDVFGPADDGVADLAPDRGVTDDADPHPVARRRDGVEVLIALSGRHLPATGLEAEDLRGGGNDAEIVGRRQEGLAVALRRLRRGVDAGQHDRCGGRGRKRQERTS